MRKLALVNHGCAKNLVDSELMLGLLAEKGYEITLDENEANVVIVNTCSFIHDAEKESVQSILKMVDAGKKVIVTGCLPQKYKDELKEAIPEVVAMLGTTDFTKIVEVVENIDKNFGKNMYLYFRMFLMFLLNQNMFIQKTLKDNKLPLVQVHT